MHMRKRPTYKSDDFSRVRLYGLELKPGSNGLDLGAVTVSASARTSLKVVRSDASKEQLNAGLIVGYAFEGGCYDLPKPKIIFTTAKPQRIPVDDCGYDVKDSADYRVWVVDKLDKCIEVEVTEGFVEQLVLEANMPTRRSPASYRSVMQVAHRNGRLTE